MIDAAGAAVLIVAIAGAIPVVGGFVLQCITFRRQAAQGRELATLHRAINGINTAALVMAERAGAAEGRADGVASERANPQTDSKIAG